MDEYYANPASSSHYEGIKANSYLEDCRAVVAQIIDAAAERIFFNSGATEANNMVIKSVAVFFFSTGNSSNETGVLQPLPDV